MTVIDALEVIELAKLGNDRLSTIRNLDSPELRKVFNWVLSPDITFGMKKVPPPQMRGHTWSDDEWLCELETILSAMMADADGKRELSGGDAKLAVSAFLGACNDTQAKWAERIIRQDMRLSVGAKDINKAIGEQVVRVFNIPLAEPFKHLKSTKGTWAIQPKYDGGRCVAKIDSDGKVKLLSRSGLEWKSFKVIADTIEDWWKTVPIIHEHVLDGEIVVVIDGRMDFQATQKLFHSKDGRLPEHGELHYFVFDLSIDYDNPSVPYRTRLGYLKATADDYPFPACMSVTTSTTVVDPSPEFLTSQAQLFIERDGADGAIIRRLDAIPQNKRSTDIVKIKPFEDAEAIVVGKVEGKGHLVGSLGTMVCRLWTKKDGAFGPEFEIGTGEGLTKKLRKDLWDDPDLIGSIINLKYLRLTNDGVPNLPTYRAIRHPNDIE